MNVAEAARIDSDSDPRQRRGAQVHLDEWVAPELADEQGLLRAGKVLEWMDVAGALAASRHCRLPVVTASVDGTLMGKPIPVGAGLTMTASIGHTSERSMGVIVSITRHASRGAGVETVLDAFMSFVAIDSQCRAQAVPQFRPESSAEMARYREGELRREFRRALPSRLALGGSEAESGRAAANEDGATASVAKPWSFLARGPRPETPSSGSDLRRRSYIHKIELVRTGKLNFVGTLYGGTLMRWIETTASLSARAYLGGAPARLVGLHGLAFQKPVRPNRFIHIQSVVAHTARTRLTVSVKVQAEEPLEGPNEDALQALLTYAPNQPSRRIEPIE